MAKTSFYLKSKYKPDGDQPTAIAALQKSLDSGVRHQTLLGVTGSGKTFTMASLIQGLDRPALILSHNKTLAAQLYGEMKAFFPNNRVEYFVSYYDYYQPEAYMPVTDTYIEKDSAINDELERMRLATTYALIEREDTIIVSSVSCIYGLGDPEEYKKMYLYLEVSQTLEREELLRRLVAMQYARNQVEFFRGNFRVRGDRVEIYPAYGDIGIGLDFFGDDLEKIIEFDPLTGKTIRGFSTYAIYPAKHYVMPEEKLELGMRSIRQELKDRLNQLHDEKKLLEAQRLEQRTHFDLEMIKETGTCAGIENYSRHFEQRKAGSPPKTLLDYLPDNAVVFIDESHVTLSQVGAMFEGDRSRKRSLVEYGFRLPSAFDNRPLYFEEFDKRVKQFVYISATPGDRELAWSGKNVAEQVIRPTGLIDPEIEIRPCTSQVDDLMGEVKIRAVKNERTLVTTLTKRMAEDLTDYYEENGVRVEYLHSDIDTIERIDILRRLRLGEFDCLVGINLLREGLDLPEVSLVGILDADKEGFLRSARSLIQTMGRAARNVEGRVILYADKKTDSMKKAMRETERRRVKQLAYNKRHGITPQTILSSIKDVIDSVYEQDYVTPVIPMVGEHASAWGDAGNLVKIIQGIEKEMQRAAGALEFEKAAQLRDQIKRLRALKPGELPAEAELFTFAKGKDKVVKRSTQRIRRERSNGRGKKKKKKPGQV